MNKHRYQAFYQTIDMDPALFPAATYNRVSFLVFLINTVRFQNLFKTCWPCTFILQNQCGKNAIPCPLPSCNIHQIFFLALPNYIVKTFNSKDVGPANVVFQNSCGDNFEK